MIGAQIKSASLPAYAELAAVYAEWERGLADITLLEAGGGAASRLPDGAKRHITIVDISAEQLAKNSEAQEKILGDLHDVDLGLSKYDVAVAWNVIEHLSRPRLVLDKMARGLKPGGALVLAWPNRNSFQGLVTRLTPHGFHVWVYRTLLKSKTAGQPGFAPFPAYLRRDIAPSAICSWLRREGFEIRFFAAFPGTNALHLRRKSPIVGRVYDAFIKVISGLTRHDFGASDLALIAVKPGGRNAAISSDEPAHGAGGVSGDDARAA